MDRRDFLPDARPVVYNVPTRMGEAAFYISAGVAVGASLAAVTRRNPIYSALWLMIAFVAFAVIYLTLHAPFLAAMHVLVYTGAILVLFLFVIMLLNLQPEELKFDFPMAGRAVLGALCAAIGGLLIWLFLNAYDDPGPAADVPESFGGATAVGQTIFPAAGEPHFILPFELVSVLIIAAMIAAIVLARPEKKKA